MKHCFEKTIPCLDETVLLAMKQYSVLMKQDPFNEKVSYFYETTP